MMDPLHYTPKREAAPVEELPLFAAAPEPPRDPHWLMQPLSRIERSFSAFHSANPHVFAELSARALRYLEQGRSRLGIAKLIEDLRDDPTFRTTHGPDALKLNNDHRAMYARLLLHRYPQLDGLLAIRERREKGAAA